MSTPTLLEYTVTPKAEGNWIFSNDDEPVKLKLAEGDIAVLTYKIEPDTAGWSFAENGTFFTEAQDNFNYNLTSTLKDEFTVEVKIEALNVANTLSENDIKALSANPDARVVTLVENNNSNIEFRLVAKKNSENGVVRYLSQDPRVIIDNPDGPG
ncbi:DP-EP family protein [Pseudoalteromonas piscicida]|uniref:DP-EP family protein n=1 Tax=Pseudoalteromonas piscicida TaxID=43662 RepID=UPI002738C088|nr:DP-EP family protein [Pseudoalteromonas piscicida]MDP4490175.1 DP-EP family protein [Pseudoalteromonas piscicida]